MKSLLIGISVAISTGTWSACRSMAPLQATYVSTNRIDRYHCVARGDPEPAVNVVFDFKLAMGLASEYLETALSDFGARRIGRLGDPWVQDLAHRYITFLGRVALPGLEE